MRRGLLGALVGAILVIGVPLMLLAPYLRDDVLLDRIVKVVALDWRDFGAARAQERLQYELDRQSIGLHITSKACTFTEADGRKWVRCSWTLQVPIPGAEMVLPLRFSSGAVVEPDGDVTP